jgi:GNAT superfamily N-acetyltransferase
MMRGRRAKMSFEEFQRVPFRLGWKQEYLNGCLIETPRQAVVHATLPIRARPAGRPIPIRPAAISDERELLPSFMAAFRNAFEYCDCSRGLFVQSARESLHRFFQQPTSRWAPCSRVALGAPATRRSARPIGAALVTTQDNDWAFLDMVFVIPSCQRRGTATALAAAALDALQELGGCGLLASRYLLGNEASRAWHHAFGFADEPDLFLTQLYLRAARHELSRLRESGQLTPEVECRLESDRIHWQAEANRLEGLLRGGPETESDPWRKWRRKAGAEVDG